MWPCGSAKRLAGQVDREKKNVADAEKEVAAATGEAAEKAKAKLEAAKKKLATLEEQYKKAAALAEGAKPLDNDPVGTGSMMFEEGSPGNYLKLKRNPNWWFGKFIGRPDMPYCRRTQCQYHPRSLGAAGQPAGRKTR